MTNLLPPQAKKQVVAEYWTRMVCAWILVWSVSLLIGVVLLWPTYVLLTGNITAYKDSTSAATERTNEYAELSQQLVTSSAQAKDVVALSERTLLSKIVQDIWDVTDSSTIEISAIKVSLTEGKLQPFSVTGDAHDRQSLAQFRDALEALPFVESVDLPIENLAKNEDISFAISVAVNNQNL